jgi:hypothetical protein
MVFIPSNAKDFNKKNTGVRKTAKDDLDSKNPKRFWGNAARLEHTNVRNKNKGKKGK